MSADWWIFQRIIANWFSNWFQTAGVPPESEKGRSLAGRWTKLIEAFTGGHAALEDGVKKVWQNFDNLPEANQQQMRPFKAACSAEMSAFIAKAMAVRD